MTTEMLRLASTSATIKSEWLSKDSSGRNAACEVSDVPNFSWGSPVNVVKGARVFTFEPLTLEYSASECDRELLAYVYIHRPTGCTLVLFND